MTTQRIHLLLFTCLVTALTFAQVPENIKDILKKRYPSIIVIEVGVYNMDTNYQLFYLPNGTLANVRNTVFGKALWPQTVTCH